MPKVPTEIKSLARSYTDKAIKVLAGIMQQPKAPAASRVAAAQALLDRGWGKPRQAIEVSGPDEGPILTATMTDAERARALAAFIAKIKASKGD